MFLGQRMLSLLHEIQVVYFDLMELLADKLMCHDFPYAAEAWKAAQLYVFVLVRLLCSLCRWSLCIHILGLILYVIFQPTV